MKMVKRKGRRPSLFNIWTQKNQSIHIFVAILKRHAPGFPAKKVKKRKSFAVIHLTVSLVVRFHKLYPPANVPRQKFRSYTFDSLSLWLCDLTSCIPLSTKYSGSAIALAVPSLPHTVNLCIHASARLFGCTISLAVSPDRHAKQKLHRHSSASLSWLQNVSYAAFHVNLCSQRRTICAPELCYSHSNLQIFRKAFYLRKLYIL